MSYFTKITTAGLTAITAAMNNSSKVPISYMAFGDGFGSVPEPREDATSLLNEVYRVGVNKVEVHNKNPNWLVCEAIIPSAVGGFNIREVALYDNTGKTMLAVASYPPTYKPTVEEGAAKIQTIRIVLQVDNTGSFELIIDPDIVLATVQYVNDMASKHRPVTPEDFGAVGDGITSDLKAFNLMAASEPTLIELNGSKRYFLGANTVFLNKTCTVKGNNATLIVSGNHVGLSPKSMLRSKITQSALKGSKTLTVEDASIFKPDQKVLIYIGANQVGTADDYYAAIQYNKDDVGYTGQVNIIDSVNTSLNQITLKNKLSYDTSNKGALQIIYEDVYKYHDLIIEHTGESSAAISYLHPCNFYSNGMKWTNPNGGVKNINGVEKFNVVKVIHQTGFQCHHVQAHVDKATCIHFNHGTVNGSVSFAHFDCQFESDGALVMYAGPVNIKSIKNTYVWHNFKLNGNSILGGSAVYFGAKSRNCSSENDVIDGAPVAFRGYFGSYDNKVILAETKNTQSYSVEMVGGYGLKLKSNNFDKAGFIRFCPNAVIDDNDFDAGWVDGGLSVPKAFQVLPQIGDASIPQDDITITNNRLKGDLYVTVGLNKATIYNNQAPTITFYASSSFLKNAIFSLNKAGGLTLRNPLNVVSFGNNWDDTPLRSLTTKRNGTIDISGHAMYTYHDETIAAESIGVYSQTVNRTINQCIIEHNNKIQAPTKKQLNITATLSPVLLNQYKDYVPIGTKFNIDNDMGYWELSGWDSTNPLFNFIKPTTNKAISINLPKFTPVSNGIFIFNPITISGLNPKSVVKIASDIPLIDGEFVGEIISSNTLQVYFKNNTNSAAEVPAKNVSLVVIS